MTTHSPQIVQTPGSSIRWSQKLNFISQLFVIAISSTPWYICSMRALILFLFVGCVGNTEVREDPDEHWHARYVADHCERCPECCTATSNKIAWLEDGGTCFEDNFDKIESGWSRERLLTWCMPDVDRSDEEQYCGTDVCPGECCPCVKGPQGLWWIDYTGFGSDEGSCNQP